MFPEVGSTIVPPGFSRPSRSAASIIATATAVLDAAARIRRLELGDERALHTLGAAHARQTDERGSADEVEDRVGRVDRRQRVGHDSTLPRSRGHLRRRTDEAPRRIAMVQRHEYSIELNAPPDDVWEVFWYRAPDRPQPQGREDPHRDPPSRRRRDGNGLVRHCYFPVPKWLLSRRRRPVVGMAHRGEAVRVVALRRGRQAVVVAGDGLDAARPTSATAAPGSRSSRSTRRSTRSCACCSRSACTTACRATTTRSSPRSKAA